MVFGTVMTLMIPTARSKWREYKAPRNSPTVPSREIFDDGDQEESRDRGTVAEQPPEALLVEHTSKDDRDGQDMPGGMPSGECWCPW